MTKMIIHVAPSLLNPGNQFVFWQTKEGAEKEKLFTTDGSALHKWRESMRKRNAKS